MYKTTFYENGLLSVRLSVSIRRNSFKSAILTKMKFDGDVGAMNAHACCERHNFALSLRSNLQICKSGVYIFFSAMLVPSRDK